MTPEQKRAMVRQLLAQGMTDEGAGMDASLREPLYMSPEYQAAYKALTAGGADMGAQAGAPPKFEPGTGMAGVYEDQSPQDQRQIAQFMKGGLSADSAFENVIGDPYGNPSRATMPPPAAPPQKQMMGQPDGFQSVFSDLTPQEQQAIAQALQAGLSVEDAFAEVLGVDMNAISRGQ